MRKIISLTIAGTDPSGGAGIQADLKTFAAQRTYGSSIITALVAQNTQGVNSIYTIDPDFIIAQADAVFTDLNVDGLKIGMLGDNSTIEAVHHIITKYKPKFIVVDPVMVAKGGAKLLSNSAIEQLRTKIIPYANIITPNLPEGAVLLEANIAENSQQMRQQAIELIKLGCKNVLLKGGHLNNDSKAMDCLVDENLQVTWFETPRISSKHTHGTGCTLSAAICAIYPQLADLKQAVKESKQYVYQAILHGTDMQIGHGIGPLNHLYMLD